MKRLQGKTAVITGGNSGIGFATTQAFLAEGAKVIITGRNAEAVHEAVEKLGANAHGIVSDSGNMAQISELAKKVGAIASKVDILFCNAGVAQFVPLADMSEAMYDDMMDINFKGAFFTIQKLLPILNDGSSVILNGTFLGHLTMGGNSAYGASKAALIHLGKTLALELVGRKIRVNTISPGAISTPIYSKLGMTEEQLGAFAAGAVSKIPMARFGEPSEIAKTAIFLASDDSSYVTGAEIIVDGGTAVQW